MPQRTIPLPGPLDLRLTLGPLRRGPLDPTLRLRSDGAWRATRTPEGPATLHLAVEGSEVVARAWGAGADWALGRLPRLIGLHDRPEEFDPAHPLLRDLSRRMAGLRIGASDALMEALVPTILEQRVTSEEAHRSYRRLVLRYGEPAPGPGDLHLPPPPEVLAALPSYELHPLGIERRRAECLRRACRLAGRLEVAVALPPPEARRLLQALPGIGPWTAAEVTGVALGDPDAVSVGDYHLPHLVSWALAGRPRADDEAMLELLEPYRGHRGRVIRLLVASRMRAPRYGPRRPLRAFEWL